MKLFGYDISVSKDLRLPEGRGSSWWWPTIRESFTGAWQQNVEIRMDNVTANPAVFACQTLIAGDISKLRVKLVARDSDGIWTETKNPAFSPVLRKPNHYQTRIQFFESWLLSKLQRGNTYALKQRDQRNVVVRLYVLNPDLVQPLISDDGEVFYELKTDRLSQVGDDLEGARVVVPAREIIHDRYNTFFHPLVGLSPIYANGLIATLAHNIHSSSASLFQNGARPGGILTAPGRIDPDNARRLKEVWETQYIGPQGASRIAILGDGLKYEALAMKAVDAQLVEQLRWSAETICSTYHVPPYKIGVGAMPSYNNVQALNVEYYTQALQKLIEDIELCLDEGLGMDGETIGTEFDLDGLLRMDSAAQMDVLDKSKGKLTVNEQRRRLDMKPVEGGDTVYLQDQDHSIAWLARRDALPLDQPPAPQLPAITQEDADKAIAAAIERQWEARLAA